jgi:hypothetical protein
MIKNKDLFSSNKKKNKLTFVCSYCQREKPISEMGNKENWLWHKAQCKSCAKR